MEELWVDKGRAMDYVLQRRPIKILCVRLLSIPQAREGCYHCQACQICVDAKPRPINIIQVYLPAADAVDEAVVTVYEEIQNTINFCHKQERLVIMGDFNAKIGANTHHRACGKYGLGETNERGKILDWMEDNIVLAFNICFPHREAQRYTWTSLGNLLKNQIDFILVRRQDRRE